MPHGHTHFETSWLSKNDRNDHHTGKWLTDPNDKDFTAKCTLCTTSFEYENSGLQLLLSHADGEKHKEIATRRFSANQFHFSTEERPGQIALPPRTHSDQVTVAEAA